MPEKPQRNDNRGIVVVDSNMLEDMSSTFPENLHATPGSPIATLANHTSSYLDVLPILAHQGYHIIIPETVMVEAAQMIRPEFIQLSQNAPIKRYRDIYPFSGRYNYPGEARVRPFLRDVMDGKHPNMEVVAANTEGTQNYQQFIGGLVEAFKIDLKLDKFDSDDKIAAAIATTLDQFKPNLNKGKYPFEKSARGIAEALVEQAEKAKKPPEQRTQAPVEKFNMEAYKRAIEANGTSGSGAGPPSGGRG